MLTKKIKIKTLIILILVFLPIFLFSNFLSLTQIQKVDNFSEVEDLKVAYFNFTMEPIFIDGDATGVGAQNWTWAISQPWCSGSGTWNDPYTLENLTINGNNFGSCIYIKDSNEYFRIKNCTLSNSSIGYYDAGIKLNRTTNGKIINNTCSFNNGRGIIVYESDNNSIEDNLLTDNDYSGLGIYGDYYNSQTCDNNNISENIIQNTKDMGGIEGYGGINTTIVRNNITNNRGPGIYLSYSNYTTYIGNNISMHSGSSGIMIEEGYYSKITDNLVFDNNGAGIDVSRFYYHNITGNNLIRNGQGISSRDSFYGNISENIINNSIWSGISVDNCNFYNLSNNEMISCGLEIDGTLDSLSTLTLNKSNTINDNPVYFYINETGLKSVNFSDPGQIILVNCNDSIISNFNLTYCSRGISILYGMNNTISDNTISDNIAAGVYLYDCDNNTVFRNNLTHNSMGIHLEGSNNTIISRNLIYNNQYLGIEFYDDCNNNTITNNTLTNNLNGISFWNCMYNKITQNNISDNLGSYFANGYGIILNSCKNNTISGNTINNNTRYGISLDSSANNTIFLNKMLKCGIGLSGSYESIKSNDINTSNLVNNDTIYIYIEQIGLKPINFSHAGQIILINCNDSVISDQDLSYGTRGIYLYKCNNISLSNITSSYNGQEGIYIWESNNNTLSKIDASHNKVGISLYRCINNSISGVNLSFNQYYGLTLSSCYNSSILANIISYSFYDLTLSSSGSTEIKGNIFNSYGSSIIENNCNYSKISWNVFNNFIIPFIIDNTGSGNFTWTQAASELAWCTGSGTFSDPYIMDGLEIDAGGSGSGVLIRNSSVYFNIQNCLVYNSGSTQYVDAGIKLKNTNNGILINNNASYNNHYGIYLENSNNNTLTGNTAQNNSALGITLEDSLNNSVLGNIVFKNKNGIFLWNSNNTKVLGNIVNNHTNVGISLIGKSGKVNSKNSISGNTINNSGTAGIFLFRCNNTIISGNTVNNSNIIANSDVNAGIKLTFSNFTTIVGNSINNNSKNGMFLDNSDTNLIYNNSFRLNTINAYDNGSNNQWDYNSLGNYWDDYGGVDANDDGIGDTPYNISGSAGSQDNYPIFDDGEDVPPTVSIILPFSGQLFGSTAPTFNVMVYDLYLDTMWYTIDSGLNNYTILINGTINQNAWNLRPNGTVVLRIYANDTSGNINYDEVTIQKDIEAPQITINSPIGGSLFGINPPNYSISVNESNLDSMWYTLDNGVINVTITELTGIIDDNVWNNRLNGSFTIKFYANDTAGNLGFDEHIINKDNIAPQFIITSPIFSDIFNYSAPAFELNINEGNLGNSWYTIDNGITNITFTGSSGVIDQMEWNKRAVGSVNIKFYVNDTVGNIGFEEVSVQIAIFEFFLDSFIIDDLGSDDYTWDQVAALGWCRGLGTWNYPYIIDNILIEGSETGSCIEIRNSNVYFIIRNSIITHSGNGNFDAAIKLNHVNNSILSNITSFYNLNFGIVLIDCFNNTITESHIFDNNVGGILLYYSNYNSIIDNNETIEATGEYGILLNSSNSNIISGNSIRSCPYGIYFYSSSDNNVTYNVFADVFKSYEEVEGSVNTFFENILLPSSSEPYFPIDYLLIIGIIAAAIVIPAGIIVYKKKVSSPKKRKEVKPKLEREVKISKLYDKEKVGLEKQSKKIETVLRKKLNLVDELIKGNNTEAALKNLNEIESLAKLYELVEFASKAEQKIIEIKKKELDTINRIKQTITNLGTKFSRLQLSDISEKSDVKNEVLIEKIIQEMLNKKEIRGEYFAGSKALALEVTTPMIAGKKKKEINVFLSYSTLDADYFEISRIVRRLELYSEITKVYFWEADSGENIVSFMEQTLQKTNAFVLFCSDRSTKSKAVEDEWQAAFQLRKEGLMKIVPVYERDEQLPYLLKPILNVKFSKDDFDGFIQKLYEEILR